ncbi:MAG: V-type ATP synthase subunit I [Actinomycetota bacterium]|nr:V-type ATP synthase subunit I [Actinomycetota bacterium]
MPIARMQKISVLAPVYAREELVDRLHRMGAVHLVEMGEGEAVEAAPELDIVPFEPDTRQLRLALARTEFILQLFERFEEAKAGLISGFLQEKVHLTLEEFLTVEKEIDLPTLYRELEELDVELRQVESEISRLEGDLEVLAPWKEFEFPLSVARGLKTVELHLGILPHLALGDWEREMEERCPLVVWEVLERRAERIYLAAAVHRVDAAEFSTIASELELERVELGEREGTVPQEISLTSGELEKARERRRELEEAVKERSPIKPRLLALKEYLENLLQKEEVKGKFLHTRRVVALRGWVEEARMEEMRRGLEELGYPVEVDFEPPGEGEVVPTLLVNRRRIKPAETLINLFGLPGMSETDPTPFVAPFFILFFGMCIGDVGYGIILTLAFWLALKKLDVSENARRFFRLFMYCGVATILVGIFTRGYFGIEGESLPGFLKFPGTLDILNDPIPIMLVCAALGLIHISIGVAIEMYDNMRHNSPWTGFCEQGTTLLLWLGIAVMAVGAGVKVDALRMAGMYIMIAGAAGVILLSNIASRSLAGKFFGGLYNMYGLLASTIGDVASYLRLYALGLATVAIGSVVNRMAAMTWGIPVLGVVFLAVILLGGHLFNLAINFLSAFVHPLRLQYVEFFGKFYEDGGEPFAPLALRTNRVVVEDR